MSRSLRTVSQWIASLTSYGLAIIMLCPLFFATITIYIASFISTSSDYLQLYTSLASVCFLTTIAIWFLYIISASLATRSSPSSDTGLKVFSLTGFIGYLLFSLYITLNSYGTDVLNLTNSSLQALEGVYAIALAFCVFLSPTVVLLLCWAKISTQAFAGRFLDYLFVLLCLVLPMIGVFALPSKVKARIKELPTTYGDISAHLIE